MKKFSILTIVFIVLAIILGYILGNVLPFNGFLNAANNNAQNTQVTGIPENKGRLVVKVRNNNEEPIVGIEIDVATQPGLPAQWGIKEANIQGLATYDIDPGQYYVFFNLNRFPSEYIVQSERRVIIIAGQQQNITFTLEKK